MKEALWLLKPPVCYAGVVKIGDEFHLIDNSLGNEETAAEAVDQYNKQSKPVACVSKIFVYDDTDRIYAENDYGNVPLSL